MTVMVVFLIIFIKTFAKHLYYYSILLLNGTLKGPRKSVPLSEYPS